MIALYSKPFLWSATSRKNVAVPFSLEFDSVEKAVEEIRKIIAPQIKERFECFVEWQKEFYGTFFDSQFIPQRKNRALQTRLMPKFFVQKGTPEYRSARFSKTKPNTNLKMFE